MRLTNDIKKQIADNAMTKAGFNATFTELFAKSDALAHRIVTYAFGGDKALEALLATVSDMVAVWSRLPEGGYPGERLGIVRPNIEMVYQFNPALAAWFAACALADIQALGIQHYGDRYVLPPGEDGFETSVRVERKHCERWGGKVQRQYFMQLSGTIGYGGMSGYYEPEWSDLDAWSTLKSHIISLFDDWEMRLTTDGQKNACPRRVKASPAGILRCARGMAKAKQGWL